MHDTVLSFQSVYQRDKYAVPHALHFGELAYSPVPIELERFVLPVTPAGGHWSTVADMARYIIFQLSNGVGADGERIVTEDNLLVTRDPQVQVSADVSYGLGWFVDEYEGIRLLRHGGNNIGFNSSFGFLPDKGIGVVVLTNGQATNPFSRQIRDYVFDLAFDNYDEEKDQEEIEYALTQLGQMVQAPAGLQSSVDPERVEPHTGRYTNEALGTGGAPQSGGQVLPPYLTLPNSGIVIQVSRQIVKRVPLVKGADSLVPSIRAPRLFTDYTRGIDAGLEAALAVIEAGER